ncbi:hypothetical protein EON62_02545 [archaeon]|nr:MAG: hypothetical protein EON62_02545 [archaeon]
MLMPRVARPVQMQKVMRIVKSIREGRYKTVQEKKPTNADVFLLWGQDDNAIDYKGRTHAPQHVPAPKLPPPGHVYSYNPPAEYLFTEEEKKAWEEADPRDRYVQLRVWQCHAQHELVPVSHIAYTCLP